MKRIEVLLGALLVPLDALAIVAALFLSYRLREAGINLFPGQQFGEITVLPDFLTYVRNFVFPSVVLILLTAAALGLYTLRTTQSAWREVGGVWVAAALWLVIVIGYFSLFRREFFYSRALLVYAVLGIGLFMSFVRSGLTITQRALLRSGIGKRTVVSLGGTALADIAESTLANDLRYQYLGHLSDLDALKRFVRQRQIDLVLQTDVHANSNETISLIDYCRSNHIGYGFLPPVLVDVPHLLQVERLGLLPIMRFQPTTLDGWGRIAKRLFDIVVSALLIIILLPLGIVIALLIVLDSGWPVFYRSVRVGEQGRKKIRVLKFRSMVQNADAQKQALLSLNHRRDGPLFKVRSDPRITRIGAPLRRWTLDELPQLWNVLLGHMSLVGPRPHLPEEVARYSAEQRRVFAVKPGVTGLAQVSGRSDLSFSEEVRFDLQYIEEWSLTLDLWILLRTVVVVLGRKGAD